MVLEAAQALAPQTHAVHAVMTSRTSRPMLHLHSDSAAQWQQQVAELTRGINDGVVPLLCEELLGCAGDGHTTLTLLLLPVHIEGKGKGLLAQGSGLLLELRAWQSTNNTQLCTLAMSMTGYCHDA